mmetsp:Transcript_25078/g.57960  ORF Transcript_25078/g.57960 Transcript_25078/m.57960 type:complete len:356 (-) Transcript_25078:327-1394(-)
MPSYELWGTSVDLQIPQDVFSSEEKMKKFDEIFDNPEHGFFESTYKKKKLHFRKNLPKDEKTKTPIKPRAIVIFAHGIQGQSGYGMKKADGGYTSLALHSRAFNAVGIALYSFDMLGHGYSEGDRFFVPDWTANRDDLVKFLRLVSSEHGEGTPVFFMGESYGGCLALHASRYLQDRPEERPTGFSGIILICPAVVGDLPPAPVVFFLRYLLAPFFPRWTPFFMAHPISAERIWKESEPRTYHTDKKESCGLTHSGNPFCLGTAVALLNAMEAVRRDVIPGLTVPFIVHHGSDDYGVPIEGTEYLLQKCDVSPEDREFVRVEGGYHALFTEKGASKQVDKQLEWIETRIARNVKK